MSGTTLHRERAGPTLSRGTGAGVQYARQRAKPSCYVIGSFCQQKREGERRGAFVLRNIVASPSVSRGRYAATISRSSRFTVSDTTDGPARLVPWSARWCRPRRSSHPFAEVTKLVPHHPGNSRNDSVLAAPILSGPFRKPEPGRPGSAPKGVQHSSRLYAVVGVVRFRETEPVDGRRSP